MQQATRIKLARTMTAAAISAALLMGGSLAYADGGGSGGQGGDGGGGSATYGKWFVDDNNHPTTLAGVKWFISKLGTSNTANNGGSDAKITAALNQAVEECKARGNTTCRVVAVGAALARSSNGTFYNGHNVVPTNEWSNYIQSLNSFANKQLAHNGHEYKLQTQFSQAKTSVYQLAQEATVKSGGAGRTNIDIVVIGNNEPSPATYNLTVTTTQQNGSKITVGGTQGVQDRLNLTSSDSRVKETLKNVQVILNWDGFGTTKGTPVMKTVTVANDGSILSPVFTPKDFTWDGWKAGRYWFDVRIPLQGRMTARVDTPDREASEQYTVQAPPMVKKLYDGDNRRAIDEKTEQLTASQTQTARVSSSSAGSSTLWLKDTILSTDVTVGKTTVTDSKGRTVTATITTMQKDGKTVVEAHLSNLTGVDTYTLNVPLTMKTTGKTWTVKDTPSRKFNPADSWTDGGEHSEKVTTPTPDKVWVLNQDGTVSYQSEDPAWTNSKGADNKTFLHGDLIGAVVNDKIPAHVTNNLYNYQIVDDWTSAAKYVDFTDASKAQVLMEQNGSWRNVTSMFTVRTVGTTTVATAKPEALKEGGLFTNGTKLLSADVPMKLVISGHFYTLSEKASVDTQGKLIKLTNSGYSVWNTDRKPTNTPPVYVWNPKPNKQVLGDAQTDGAHADSDINSLQVLPGQTVKYKIGVDVNVPTTLGYTVNRFAVRDSYDAHYTPNLSTLQLVDNRNGSHVIPRTDYTVSQDVKNHEFTVTMSTDWVKNNLGKTYVNSSDNGTAWLTVTFTGKVNADTPQGTTIRNQAFQIINKDSTPTNLVKNIIPSTKPLKEDLNVKGDNIDTKYVNLNSTIVYRLTLNAKNITRANMAYYVHKLGMSDDYDENYLTLTANNIRVVQKDTGRDVTSMFNIQVKNGKAYIYAKQVDHRTVNGTLVKGDPQPTDLAAYDTADIHADSDPIISQNLLGHDYYVMLTTRVRKSTDGYVIRNQAIQNIENQRLATNVVSNPLQEIKPKKDVVITMGGKSINNTTVKKDSVFDYRLTSSLIHANRADDTTQWALSDRFDTVHDQFTGGWTVVADTDLYQNGKVVYRKGDTLASSAAAASGVANQENVKSVGANPLFQATWQNGTLTVQATPAMLTLLNGMKDHDAQYSVYAQIIRIAPGTVYNTVDETYNNMRVKSNRVVTRTPDHPNITLEKWDTQSGMKTGDRDTAGEALTVEGDTPITFTITNTGDSKLRDVTLTDKTIHGTGTVQDITYPAGWDHTLNPGQTVTVTGILRGVTPGVLHTDRATVTAVSTVSGKRLTVQDDWNGKRNPLPVKPAQPSTPVKPALARTGEGVLAVMLAALAVGLAGLGVTVVSRRVRRH